MDILKVYPTRSALVKHLAQVKEQNIPNYNQYERDIWQQWARKKRPARVSHILHVLFEKAEREQTITYGDLAKILELGSHNELNILINHVGAICLENNWPRYAVLIKNQTTGRVGEGFFKAYQTEIITSIYNEEEFEKICEQKCYSNPIPDHITVICALLKYFHRQTETPKLEH